jgi:putative Holliday junction resolvase
MADTSGRGPAPARRTLALDVGHKRIGVAVSDPLGLTAQGLGVVVRENRDRDLARLLDLARPYLIGEVLVGLPRHLDGRLGAQAEEILDLARALAEVLEVPVITWDERLTTVQAERVLIAADLSRTRRRRVVDQVAATIMLQAYLDSKTPL